MTSLDDLVTEKSTMKTEGGNAPEKKAETNKSRFWDYLVSAYSSGKAVQTSLALSSAGLPAYICGIAGIGTYIGVKTVGNGLKMIGRYIQHPIRSMQPRWIKKNMAEAIASYNPFGEFRLPSMLGATIGGINSTPHLVTSSLSYLG